MAPTQSRPQGADFLAPVSSGGSQHYHNFLAARSRGLGSPRRSPTTEPRVVSSRNLVGGLTAWCQGVIDQLEQAVPDARFQQQALALGLTAIPSFGTCVPIVRCGPVAITGGALAPPHPARRLRLQSTVTVAKAAARKRQDWAAASMKDEGDDEDFGPVDKVNTIANLTANQFREARLTISSMASLGLASFLAGGPRAAELRASTCGILASLLSPLASGGGALALSASPGGPAMAFCPIGLSCLDFNKGFSLSAPIRELTMQELEKGVLVATFVQGSFGIMRMCLGDVFTGAYALLLATLGYNSRRPGPASNWLKTYVLITFINGTMSGIDVVQQTLLQNYLVVSPALPFAVNAAHFVALLGPGVSFLGAYCGWQHIKMQRKATIQAYQDQMMMLMEQPPWPPPPLPFPFPGMQGMPGMPGFQMVEDDAEDIKTGSFGRLQPVQEGADEEEEEAVAGGSS